MKTRIGQPLTLADGTEIPLSRGIESNGFVFVSGQLGLLEDGALIQGGIEAQTEQAIANIRSVLAEISCPLDNIVKITGWITDAKNFKSFNNVYGRFFEKTPPARSMVVSELLIPGALVELEAIAVREQ